MIQYKIRKNVTSFCVVKKIYEVEFTPTKYDVEETHELLSEEKIFEGSIGDCYLFIKAINENLIESSG